MTIDGIATETATATATVADEMVLGIVAVVAAQVAIETTTRGIETPTVAEIAR